MTARITHLNTFQVDKLRGSPDEVCAQAKALFPWAAVPPNHHTSHDSHSVQDVLRRIDAAQNYSVEVEA